jgi:hypothetical protein
VKVCDRRGFLNVDGNELKTTPFSVNNLFLSALSNGHSLAQTTFNKEE